VVVDTKKRKRQISGLRGGKGGGRGEEPTTSLEFALTIHYSTLSERLLVLRGEKAVKNSGGSKK